MLNYGPEKLKCAIGFLSPKRNVIINLTAIMASSILSFGDEIKLCTYNMYGFNNGLPMLKSLMKSFHIVLVQEHWLLKSDLFKLDTVDAQFQSYSLSSMNAKAASGIITGRNYGGTAILWHKQFADRIQVLECDDANGKFISIKFRNFGDRDCIITCVYFPCLTVSKDYIVNSSEIISHIENILTQYSDCYHILAGDYNFAYTCGNIGFDIFKDIVADYDLVCCDGMVTNRDIQYTYHHETLGHQSWLDHFFISGSLGQYVSCCDIIDDVNFSDHLPISCIIKLPVSNTVTAPGHTPSPPRRYAKERWDKADLVTYYSQSGALLQTIVTPVSLLHCPVGCHCEEHKVIINKYYESIVSMLKRASSACVPRIPVKCLRPYWSADLDEMKSVSVDLHVLWRSIGSPRTGVINAARLSAKLKYKQAIKQAALDYEQNNADEINMRFNDNDQKAFWRLWSSKYNKNLASPVSVAGQSDPAAIANEFKESFSKIYVNSANNVSAVSEFYHARAALTADASTSQAPITVDIESVERCVQMLKPNKASGHDGISAEHVINSHPAVILHFKLLFTMLLTHSYVPLAFGHGIIVPIVKDKRGDLSSIDNYRPITLSPIISKVFESYLLVKYASYMCSDDLQFGFKKGLGCRNALFALRHCIQFFNEHGSNVYVASLDASKAFDKVNHFKLFTTLIRCGLPISFIDLIANWYGKLSVVVRWNGSDSSTLSVSSGVRQGGILSPIMFNVYVNCMITSLRDSNNGCHVRNFFIGCIMYADDMLLLSASVIQLQKMLDLCGTVGSDLGLSFNCTKSKCLAIGPVKIKTPSPMCINKANINWVNKIQYLGLTINAGKKFDIDFSDTRRKFFMSVNSILSNGKHTADTVKLKLLESHCLPILLYAIESLDLNGPMLKSINSWWNAIYRKIFGYHKWESVKILICMLGRLDVMHLVNLRRLSFIKQLLTCDNSVMRHIMVSYCHGPELRALQDTYNISISWSLAKIKALTFISFNSVLQQA